MIWFAYRITSIKGPENGPECLVNVLRARTTHPVKEITDDRQTTVEGVTRDSFQSSTGLRTLTFHPFLMRNRIRVVSAPKIRRCDVIVHHNGSFAVRARVCNKQHPEIRKKYMNFISLWSSNTNKTKHKTQRTHKKKKNTTTNIKMESIKHTNELKP